MNWVFLTDVDGTLDYHCQGISKKIYSSAKEFIQLGGNLGLATGRALISTKEIAKKIGVNIPCILLGGSLLYDFIREKVMWTCTLPKYVVEAAEEIARSYIDVAVLAYTEKDIFLYNSNDLLFRKGVPEELKNMKSLQIERKLLKLNLVGEHDKVHEIIKKYFDNQSYEVAFASQNFAEIVSSKAGKGNAMQVLSDMLSIPVKRFIAMGDASNDIEMLRRAGIALTLENAMNDVKKYANVILPHCKENGGAKGFVYATEIIQKSVI